MKTNLQTHSFASGKLYSHALLSALMVLGLAFGNGAGKPDKKKKTKSTHEISWRYESYKIKSSAVLSIALPNMLGSGQTQILTGCFDTGTLALYQKEEKGLKFIRSVGQVKGGITDIKLLSMDGAQNKAVVVHEGTGTIEIFDLKSNDKPITLFHGPHSINSVKIADFNGDGLGDIIPVSYDGRTEVWFQNTENEGFVKRKLPVISRKVSAIEVADFDFDGDQDILIASDYSKMIKIFVNEGQGDFTRAAIADGVTGVLDIEVLDMDMDGYMDVAYASHHEKQVQLLLQKEEGFVRRKVSTKLRSLNNIEVFDLANNGRPDLVISSFDDDAIRIIENSASGLREHQFLASIPAPTDIEIKSDPVSHKTTVYVSTLAKNRVFEIDVALEQ